MNTNEQTRLCPYCQEAINPAARTCPHCRQWLGRIRIFPYLSTIILYLLIASFLILLIISEFRGDRKEEYTKHPGSLTVIETTMNYTSSDWAGPKVSVIGRIKNNSDIPWYNIELEVRYFDESGNLIDTNTETFYGTVPAHNEAAFRSILEPIYSKELYARHEIRIRTASDARSWYGLFL